MVTNLVVTLTILGIISASYGRDLEGPPKYEVTLIFESGISNCEGYENKIIRTEKIYAQKVNKSLSGLAGNFEITEDINGPIKCTMTIQQQVNGNWEYCCTFDEEYICDTLGDGSKPWSPYFANMNITGCPVLKGNYTVGSTLLNTKGDFPVPRENKFYRIEGKLFQNEIELGCYILDIRTEITNIL